MEMIHVVFDLSGFGAWSGVERRRCHAVKRMQVCHANIIKTGLIGCRASYQLASNFFTAHTKIIIIKIIALNL